MTNFARKWISVRSPVADLFVFALLVLLVCMDVLSHGVQADEPSDSTRSTDWTYRTAHNYVPPLREGVQMTDVGHIVRPIWSYPLHTGINSSSAGLAIRLLQEGFEPTYGETAAAVVIDDIYLLSWSEATGDVVARPESITDRYHRGEENYAALKDTYFRIDANWNTIAINASTGEKLWQASQPSASINFQSSKRDHNGLDPVAGNGIYVTMSILGRVFAYDLATGELRWETHVGGWHEAAEAFKAECLEKRNLPIVNDGPFGNVRSGAAMVGELVILPDLRGGLIALQASDGSEQWRIDENVMNRQGNPRLWEHEGKTYLITHTIHTPHNRVHLIDPETGTVIWTHKTGYNPGKLLMGEGMVLLNPSGDRRKSAILEAFRITVDGLEKQWAFPKEDRYRVPTFLGGSRSWERKGVIADGFLYMAIGQPKQERRVAVYDLHTGEELYRSEDHIPNNNIGAPFVTGDKLYWHISSTGAQNSGLYIYLRHDDGTIALLDEFRYRSLGAMITTDYLHPTDRPVSNGRIFVRGYTNLLAIDLRQPIHPPVTLAMEGAWRGFVRPVQGVLIAEENGMVDVARLEVPPRSELGVPGTTARRTDTWGRMEFHEPLRIGEAWDTTATMHMEIFSWPAHIVMEEREGDQWHGTWTRHFKGWEDPLALDGAIHESSMGGISGRGWLTPWLENQPISMYSKLEEGQERILLNLFNALPREDGTYQNMTLALDHDGKVVVGAVALGSRFNQSYHEVDASNLTVSEDGISGTAYIILNGDPWVKDVDWIHGGSLLGRLALKATFGEANAEGFHPVRGEWSLEWGLEKDFTGRIQATLPEAFNKE